MFQESSDCVFSRPAWNALMLASTMASPFDANTMRMASSILDDSISMKGEAAPRSTILRISR